MGSSTATPPPSSRGAGVSTTATSTSNAGTYPITVGIGTLAASNYNFSNLVNGVLTVNKAQLTVTANPATMIYGGALPTFSATLSGFVNNDTPAVVSGAAAFSTTATSRSPAGSYSLNVSAGTLTATNYDFPSLVGNTLTINQAPLTVTANSISTPYGVLPTLTYTISGFVNGETAAVVNEAPVLSTTANATSPVGTYPISITTGTLSASNYDFPTLTPGSLTIGKAVLVVTANAAQMTYSGTVPSLTYTVNGFVNGDTASILSGTPALNTTATPQSNVGVYPITVGAGTLSVGSVVDNYTLTYVNGALTVNKASLTVTANPRSRSLNAPNPTFTATISGFVNGDTATVVTGTPVLSTTAVTSSPVGTYPITVGVGTLSAQNYDFTNLVGGILTVRNEAAR